MLKHFNDGWEISKKHNKVFPAQKYDVWAIFRNCRLDKPDHLIVHVGTNDLNSEVSSKSIAKLIVDLAMSVKTKSNDVSVSNIVLTTDNPLLKLSRM